MGIEERPLDAAASGVDVDLVVDAIFGTGLTRPPTGVAAEAIEWINDAGTAVLAVDVPSGLDCDTGRPLGPCVRATRTVSFVGTKPGFREPTAREYVGEVRVGDEVELLS